jgi:DNA-binding CsgD family transcriptional regulator
MKAAAARARAEPDDIGQALNRYIRKLAGTPSLETIGTALSDLGAVFNLPYLELVTGDTAAGERRVRTVYRSPNAPKEILKALHLHPLATWSLASEVPVSLAEMTAKAAERGLTASRALAAVAALMINKQTGPGTTLHAAFYGKHGTVNGLTRSTFVLALALAHQRSTTQTWPVADTVALTPRELEVLNLAMTGLTDAGVGKALGLGTRTVRFHLANAVRKAHISSRSELIAMAARLNARRPR